MKTALKMVTNGKEKEERTSEFRSIKWKTDNFGFEQSSRCWTNLTWGIYW